MEPIGDILTYIYIYMYIGFFSPPHTIYAHTYKDIYVYLGGGRFIFN